MNILYISSVLSKKIVSQLPDDYKLLDYTGQKYHSLFIDGLANQDIVKTVFVLSSAITPFAINDVNDEQNGKVQFKYAPYIRFPFIKQIIRFFYSFFYAISWHLKQRREEKTIICSLMRIYQFIPVWLVSLFFKCKIITVACDVPWMTTVQVSGSKLSIKQKFSIWLGKKLCGLFDGYVLLTNSMNSVLNPNHRPSIVVEGFCDDNMKNRQNQFNEKEEKTIIIYAGGINEKYGIMNLINAVKLLNDDDVELWIYGKGDLQKVLLNEKDKHIKYFGVKRNEEVVDSEIKATLLINPRPTTDEYTHYSFPSKILEYMVSGTYTLTTKLAGIPDEYFDFCGIIPQYDAEGIANTIKNTLMTPRDQLHSKGLRAKQFVLENKNHIKQTKRVVDFLYGL